MTNILSHYLILENRSYDMKIQNVSSNELKRLFIKTMLEPVFSFSNGFRPFLSIFSSKNLCILIFFSYCSEIFLIFAYDNLHMMETRK
jgi:hypothetical protein